MTNQLELETKFLEIASSFGIEGEATKEVLELINNNKVNPDLTEMIIAPRSSGQFIKNDKDNELRSDESLSFEVIEKMMKSGIINFVVDMKRSSILAPFKNDRGYTFKSENETFAKKIKKEVDSFISKMMLEITYDSLVYGTYIAETLYFNKKEGDYITYPKLPAIVPIDSVTQIRRSKRGIYKGFIQENFETGKEISIKASDSIVVPHKPRNRNLFGRSMLMPLYALWFWYNIILLALVRYNQKLSNPTSIGRAPSNEKVQVKGNSDLISSMEMMNQVQQTLAHTDYVTLPNDLNRDTNNYKYELSYLEKNDNTSASLINALHLITSQMILSANFSGNAVTEGTGGSYNSAQGYQQITAIHNQMLLTEYIYYLNKYYFSKIAELNGKKELKIETTTLDNNEKTMLMELLKISGNFADFNPLINIDWNNLLKLQNFPLNNKLKPIEIKQEQDTNNTDLAENFTRTQQKTNEIIEEKKEEFLK